MIKLLLTNLFVLFCNKQLQLFSLYYHFLSIGVRMSWNIGENWNLFLKFKSKLELHHVVLSTPKTSPEKITLTLVEMQQLPEIEKVDSKNEISCLKRTIYNGRRKVCISFKTDVNKLNIVVHRTVTETIHMSKTLKWSWNWLNTKNSYLNEYIYWVTMMYSLSGALYWMKQLFIIKVNFIKNGCSFPHEHFPIVPGIRNVIWTQ